MTPSQGGDSSADPRVLIIVSAPEVSPLLSEGTIDVNWGAWLLPPSMSTPFPPTPLPLPESCKETPVVWWSSVDGGS